MKITFDCFYVAEYPGASKHQVLFHFTVQNQVRGLAGAETVHFNTTCEVSNNEAAALQGFPLFMGLRVGNEGMTLECETINVTNQRDQEILGILKSNVLKTGIKLISTLQPALSTLSDIAVGLVGIVCKRNENVRVYKFQLGLDFSGLQSRGFLAEGSYVVTQMPAQLQQLWNWNDWAYHIDSGLIINKSNPQQHIPYNYFIFGISRYQDA